jgi:CubicO group peptidase (beta-lactamase class C family)
MARIVGFRLARVNPGRYIGRVTLDELSPERFPLTWAKLREGLAEGVAPGMVAGLWLRDEPARARVAALGFRRTKPTSQPMEVSTVFDLASVTKVFATATLAAALVDRGWLSWDTPLRAFFPELPEHGITLSHLLAHTAGFPAWEPLWQRMRERFAGRELSTAPIPERQRAMRELVFAVKPEARPGERMVYSDICFLLLGFALESATGMPLDLAVERFLWQPMGIRGAFFTRVNRGIEEGRLEHVAATEDCPWRGSVLQGQVHDDNCWAMGGYAGHAGAFADVSTLLDFVRALFDGFLSPATLRAMWTRVSPPLGPPGCERTLGWDSPSGAEPSAGRFFPPLRTVGHLGFTGTSLWIDLEAGLAVALLSNRVHPTRENGLFKPYRSRFHEALRRDLGAS